MIRELSNIKRKKMLKMDRIINVLTIYTAVVVAKDDKSYVRVYKNNMIGRKRVRDEQTQDIANNIFNVWGDHSLL